MAENKLLQKMSLLYREKASKVVHNMIYFLNDTLEK